MRISRPLLIVTAICAAALAGVLAYKLPTWLTYRKALLAYRDAHRLLLAVRLPEAEVRAKEALALYQKRWGTHHADVTATWNLLGTIYFDARKVPEAEDAYQKAIRLERETVKEPSPELAGFLSNLGNLRYATGQFHESLKLYQEALRIREAKFGAQRKEIAISLNHIAVLHATIGQYPEAEELGNRAKNMLKALHLEKDVEMGNILNTLGAVYKEQGAFDRAETSFREAVELWKGAPGEQRLNLSNGYGNLGILAVAQGNFQQALQDLREAHRLRTETLGKDHPQVAFMLTNLATTDVGLGDLSGGLAKLEEARKVFEKSYGRGHPYTIAGEISMAGIFLQQGELDRATSLLQTARGDLELLGMGERHPFYTEILGGMARVLAAGGQFDAAVEKWRQEFVLAEQRINNEAILLTEERRAALFNSLREEEEHIYSEMLRQPNQAGLRRLATAITLLRKGRALDVAAALSRIEHSGVSATDRQPLEKLHAMQSQYADLSVSGVPGATDAQIRPMLVELGNEIEELRRSTSQRLIHGQSPVQIPDLDAITAAVRAALPPNAMLVEFVKYRQRRITQATDDPHGTWRYLALLLTHDSPEAKIVDLGEALNIDRAANRMLAVVSNPQANDGGESASLYAMVFKPLEPMLKGKVNLFLSLDGQLNVVPFAALQDGQQVLLDRFQISYLTSGRDLLPRRDAPPPSRSVVVVANPAFDKVQPPMALAVAATTERRITFSNLTDLPGTEQEAQEIQKLFPEAALLIGAAASESAVRKLEAPGILHIATHGGFLGDVLAEPAPTGIRPIGITAGMPPQNPLLRSALALAGAGLRKRDLSTSNPDDGYFTAMELSAMNLWRTQIVVLSACDTGRGEVMVGQGVYGLRRAVMAAGAETLVTSLWKLDDAVAKDLMTAYYRQLLDGAGRGEALQRAASAIRKNHTHPYFWASLVVLGNILPLRWKP